MEKNQKSKPTPDDKEQARRFEETARSIGVDETGEAFSRAIGGILSRKEKTLAPKTKSKTPRST